MQSAAKHLKKIPHFVRNDKECHAEQYVIQREHSEPKHLKEIPHFVRNDRECQAECFVIQRERSEPKNLSYKRFLTSFGMTKLSSIVICHAERSEASQKDSSLRSE